MTKEHTMRRWELLAAVGAAWWVETLVTIEWSYPYCSVLDNGPAGAVFGFPFPYEQASIVTSATYFFIPWLYVVNLVVIAGCIFLLLRPLTSRFGKSKPRARKVIVGAVGGVLLASAILLELATLVLMDVRLPASSFDESPRYSELRPVLVFRRHRDCTASTFWFPDKPKPKP